MICAAALTLKPMLELAGVEARGRNFTPEQADKAGLDGIVEIATNVARANYVGPLLAAATFVRYPSSARLSGIPLTRNFTITADIP